MSDGFNVLFEYNLFLSRIQDPDEIVNVFEEWYDGNRSEGARMAAVYAIDAGKSLADVRLLLAGEEISLEEQVH